MPSYIAVAALASTLLPYASSSPLTPRSGLSVHLDVLDGLFNGSTPVGRAVLMFAPQGQVPSDDYDDTTTANYIYGRNVYGFNTEGSVDFAVGNGENVWTEVFGWPKLSLDDVPPGNYSVQAYLTRYETVARSDGSRISVRFPCGDGAPPVNAPGSLVTPIQDVVVTGSQQNINLTFDNVTAADVFTGKEIGGCHQGNYEDTALLKYVKIRSVKLSEYWHRDMYVGANVLLPYGYNASDQSKRYPVIYSQGHWPGAAGAFRYPTAAYSKDWDRGINPTTNQTAPQLIMITFRHETPLYDDSYAVNTANLGPWGDAINDELIPYIDKTFNTIAQPYARIQEGGSTGGWESAANLIFRPDLFGYCFSSYPDSLDFHRHQDIHLYDESSAYYHADGSSVPSIRQLVNGTETVLISTEGENHWELSFGTSSRSDLQWDIWNAIFGAQGYNGYPLEPWNKVTGEIYPAAVEYWKDMDLAAHIVDNWDNKLNLGNVLRHRVFVYVGDSDNYYLNEGVQAFQKTVSAKGGDNWANITILAGKQHGGNYQSREIWNYLSFLEQWIQDHSPTGASPLPANVTAPSARGNIWDDVLRRKGRLAAIGRQAWPAVTVKDDIASGTVGRWDPGMNLTAQWQVDGKNAGDSITAKQGDVLILPKDDAESGNEARLIVTGRKSGYADETRKSKRAYLCE